MYEINCQNCTKKIITSKPRKMYCVKDGIDNKIHMPKWAWDTNARNCREYDCIIKD